MSGKEWENERSSVDFGDKVWVFPFSQETKLVDFKNLTQIVLKDNHKEDIETSGAFPSSRLGSTLSSVGEEVFVLFGFSDRYENEVSVLNKETFQWVQRQTENRPLPRTFHTANTFGNNIYIFGGNYLTKAFNDLIILESGSHKFNRIAAEGTTPSPRFSHTSAIVGDSLYIIGGTDGNTIFNDIFVYHISSNTWSQLPSTLPPLANAISSVSSQNIIIYDPQTGGFYSINTDSKATSTILSLQNERKLRTIAADDSSLYLVDDQSSVYSINSGELNYQDITNDQSAISHSTSPKGANELAHKELLLVRADIDALKLFRQKYSDFQNELSSAKQTTEELQSQLSSLREELNTSNQHLSNEQTSHSNTREESTRLQNEIAELKSVVSLATEESQKLREELSIASSNENKGDSPKKDSDELQAKDREILKLKEALAEKNKIVETQQTTITSLNQLAALLSSSKSAAPVADPKIEELTQLCSEKDKRLGELEEQISTLRNSESQSNSLQTTVDSLNETVRSYESKILSLETEIANLNSVQQQLQEEVNVKTEALAVSQTLSNELQLLIQVKDRVIEELESSSQKTPETATDSTAPIPTESEGDDEKLLFIMSEFDSYKAAVEEEKESLLCKIDELSNFVQTLTNDLQLAQENISSLQEQLNNGGNGAARGGDDAYFALEEEHNILKQSITSIKEEHLNTTKLLREKIADLNIKLATSGGSKETKNLQAQVSKLTEEITTFQKLVEEQQLAIQEKDNDIQLLLNTVEENKQIIEKLEGDIEVWMTTTDQIQKIGEDAVTEISKEAVALRAENEKLQQQISDEIQRRRYAEEELFNSEAKLKDIEGLMGRLSGSL